MNNEDLKKLRCYNITRYLLSCHIKQQKPDEGLMNLVDFSEVGNIDVVFYTDKNERINYKVEETLAQNCLDNLPFEAYKDYITAEWIGYHKDRESSIISSAFYKREKNFLEHVHQLASHKVQQDKDFQHSYFRLFLEPILNLPFNLSQREKKLSQEFVDFYYDLFKHAHDEKKYWLESQFEKKEPQKPFKRSKNTQWLSSVLFNKNYRDSDEDAFNSLLSTLTNQTEYKKILDDALSQGIKKFKDISIIRNCVLGKNTQKDKKWENVIANCVISKNLSAINTFVDLLDISNQEVLSSVDLAFAQSIERIQYNSSASEILNNSFANFYDELKKQYFPQQDTKYLVMFAFSDNEEKRSQILQNKDIYFPEKLLIAGDKEKISANDVLLISKCLDDFTKHLQEEQKKIHYDINSLNKNSILSFVRFIRDKSPQLIASVDMREVPQETWDWAFKVLNFVMLTSAKCRDEKGKEFPLIEYAKGWFAKYQLEQQLDNSNDLNPKKLKI